METARERQRERFKDSSDMLANADMGPAEVREYCPVSDAGRNLLRAAMQQLQMSARCLRDSKRVLGILKLSRTIADLAGTEGIETALLVEAIQYRPRRQTQAVRAALRTPHDRVFRSARAPVSTPTAV